ncbi:MAG: hypothetical protein QM710_13150 [Flavobacterium sp.]
MNILKVFICSLLLASTVSFGQSAYGRGLNNGYNNYNQNHQPKAPTAEEIEEHRNESIDNYMAKLKADLNLDDLQFIAIKNEIVNNNKSIDIVMKKETDQEAKSKEIKALSEKAESNIMSYLNKDQKEKFQVFKANMYKKKDKKDKKGKEKRSTDDLQEEVPVKE